MLISRAPTLSYRQKATRTGAHSQVPELPGVVSLWGLAMLLDAGRLRGHGATESSVERFVESTAVVIQEITL